LGYQKPRLHQLVFPRTQDCRPITVRNLPSQKDSKERPKPLVDMLEDKPDLEGKRAVLIDVGGGFYALKKTLRADIGFFEKDFMLRAGQEGAKNCMADFLTRVRARGREQALIEMLRQYTARGYGDFKLTRIDENLMMVEITSSNTAEAWAFNTNKDMQREPVCSYTSGMLSGLCSLVFADSHPEDIEFGTVEVECTAQGDKECKFIVGPTNELYKHVPSHNLSRDSISEHVLRLNEEILLKNLELQSLNLSLEKLVRKRTEDLRRSEENYRSLVELLPDPVVICTMDGDVSSINESGLKLLGYESLAEAEKINLMKLLAKGSDAWEKLVWQIEKEGAVHNLELELVKKGGARIIGEISARFADLAPGKCVEAVIRDVTEKRVIQAQIVEAKSETEFLNDLLSHDITNFTVSALYFLDTLKKSSNLSDQDRKTLATVRKDIQGAFELSTSVRDLSRLKSMSEDEIEVKELQQILSEGIEEAMRLYSERKATIEFERSPEPKFFSGNPVVSRLFTNLLTNAIKFDSSDEVLVNVTIEDEVEDGVAYWRVEVSDRGRGIPDVEKEKIFERFHRLDTSVPGTGLGLFVARFVTKACGGTIWAEDRVPGDHTKGAKMVVLLRKATHRQVAEVSKIR
jgi:PAS domain S-box-containing protein